MQRLAEQSSSRARVTALLLAAIVEVSVVFGLLHGLAIARWSAPDPAGAIVAFRDFRGTPPAPVQPARPHTARTVAPLPHAASSGRQAAAQVVAAPSPRIVLSSRTAAAGAATGPAVSAGASRNGTAADMAGQGVGGGGSGGDGGVAVRPVKLSGEIDSARDYPATTRELRLGDHVVLALGVDATGTVDDCRVVRASRDAAADAITCRLARARFRFRPARDGAGNAIRSTFGWQQRWFRPGGG